MADKTVNRFASLKFKFALALALFCSILMISVMLILEQRLRETLVSENIDKGLGVARGLAFNAEDPLLAGDDLYLFSAVNNAIKAPGVEYALILDRKRTVRAGTVMDRIGKPYQADPAGVAVKQTGKFKVYRTAGAEGVGILDLQVPIMTIAEPPLQIGEIHLGLSEAVIQQNIQSMRTHLIGLSIMALILGCIGAAVLARMMVGPLTALMQGVRAIGEGNLEQHIELKRSDELGVLTDAFNNMAANLRDKEFIKSTFERYVSKQLAEQILEQKDELRLGGEVREVTVLFSDIRRFTSLAEKLPPEQVVEILNNYFTRMIDIVNRHEGMVDKLMGDSVMALFGAPISIGDDPLRAIRCAVEMQREGLLFSQEQEAKGQPALPMGIGINTGPVVAGNIGSSTKMEYTVIGDEVNIAARMQGIAKPGEVLISENTFRLVAKDIKATPLEPITFKGKNSVVAVYRVDGLVENE